MSVELCMYSKHPRGFFRVLRFPPTCVESDEDGRGEVCSRPAEDEGKMLLGFLG